jgi:hypothetical protein
MKEFFDQLRKTFKPLSESQVKGIEAIVNATKSLSIRHRAYVLATAWHETARTMQPIEEYGKGKGKKYGERDPKTGHAYYGRGYVQLTWKTNYERAQRRLKELGLISDGVDFVNNPNLVMDPRVSALILVIGMSEGWFTGKKMADFDSYTNMRRVVNGTDKAALIATYAEVFEDALKALKPVQVVVPPPPDVEPMPVPPPIRGTEKSIAAWIIGAILVAFAALGAWLTQGGN